MALESWNASVHRDVDFLLRYFLAHEPGSPAEVVISETRYNRSNRGEAGVPRGVLSVLGHTHTYSLLFFSVLGTALAVGSAIEAIEATRLPAINSGL